MSANKEEPMGGIPMQEVETDRGKPFAQEGYDLMAAVFEVHKEIGGGLLEEIYQKCLELELSLRGIPFRPKAELVVYYKGKTLNKRYVPDLLVQQHIVVELKSVRELIPDHEAQLLNYMRITRQPVGYLITFGPIAKVEWKRFVLSEFIRTANQR
jgi:GxxExxY protein